MPHGYSTENHDWDLTLRAAWSLVMIGQAAEILPTGGIAKERVVEPVRNDAVEAIRKADCILSIGYEFSPADRGTYTPLLDEFTAPILVICPSARSICERLRADYARVSWVPRCSTFADWAEAGFPLDKAWVTDKRGSMR